MDFIRAISLLNIGASAVLLVRLLQAGLWRAYRFLFAYVLFDLIYSVTLANTPMRTKLYGDVYMTGTAVELLLAVAVVMELYSRALEEHPALAKFGSRAVGYLLVAAGIVAASALGIDDTIPAGQSLVLHRFFRVERTMDFGIVIFLVIVSVLLVWFPIRVRRNIAYYVAGFALFYASRSAGILFVNVLPHGWQRPIDIVVLCISFTCLLGLAVFLRPERAFAEVVPRRVNTASATQLTIHLESINTALSRMARR